MQVGTTIAACAACAPEVCVLSFLPVALTVTLLVSRRAARNWWFSLRGLAARLKLRRRGGEGPPTAAAGQQVIFE